MGGGGSSKVHPWHVTSVLQGIEAEYPDAEVWYAEGISNAYKPRLFRSAKFYTEDGKQGLRAKYYKMGQGDGSALPDKLMQQQAKAAGRTEDSDNGVSAVSSSVSAKSSDKEPVMERIDRHGFLLVGELRRKVWARIIVWNGKAMFPWNGMTVFCSLLTHKEDTVCGLTESCAWMPLLLSLLIAGKWQWTVRRGHGCM